MKNKDQDLDQYKNDLNPRKNLYSDSYKTTNVNILLNRVRLDKKKTLRKKFTFAVILLAATCGLIAYLLI